MWFLFIILFGFSPLTHAKEYLDSEQQGTLSYHLSDDPEEVLHLIQTLLEQKCNTGENSAACSAKEVLEEHCNADNPDPFCLSKHGILMTAVPAFFPHIPALHFSPQELNQRFNQQDVSTINLLPDPRNYLKNQGRPGEFSNSKKYLKNQGRPGEFISTSDTPKFFVDDDGNAIPNPPIHRLKGNTFFNKYQEEISHLQFPERDMKIVCSIADELHYPDYCLGWLDPENRPKDR